MPWIPLNLDTFPEIPANLNNKRNSIAHIEWGLMSARVMFVGFSDGKVIVLNSHLMLKVSESPGLIPQWFHPLYEKNRWGFFLPITEIFSSVRVVRHVDELVVVRILGVGLQVVEGDRLGYSFLSLPLKMWLNIDWLNNDLNLRVGIHKTS